LLYSGNLFKLSFTKLLIHFYSFSDENIRYFSNRKPPTSSFQKMMTSRNRRGFQQQKPSDIITWRTNLKRKNKHYP